MPSKVQVYLIPSTTPEECSSYHCRQIVNQMLTSTSYDYRCHSGFVRAIIPYGLIEFDVHNVLNIFQVTGLDPDGCNFMEASSATPDSHIEFFAEQDLLCALSTCPGGDLSTWGWDMADGAVGSTEGSKEMEGTCRLIRVDIWDIAEEKRVDVLRGWEPLRRLEYRSMHREFQMEKRREICRDWRTRDASGMGTEFFWTELVIPSLLVLNMLIVEAKD